MKVTDVAKYLELLAPKAYQEEYDNSGLICSHEEELTGILVSLDCTEAVIQEAIDRRCNMVVAHHPIVFRAIKSFTGKNYIERTIIKAIRHGVAIYAIHTNLDNVVTGVNSRISSMMGLQNTRILAPKKGMLRKLFTFVPSANADQVRDALFSAGAGTIGHYSECSYNVEGFGTFKAGAGTNPHVGKQDIRHQEAEVKLEVIFPQYIESRVMDALKASHPYEEVAYDIVSLVNELPNVGSGMIGELAQPEEFGSFMARIKETFGCKMIRYSGNPQPQIQKVAVCGGSGFFLLSAAKAAGADILITSDIKYHEFFDAESEIVLADIGHFESEQFTIDLLTEELKKKFTTFAVLQVKINTNPVKYV